MFIGCKGLKTIYCENDWSKLENLTVSNQMFYMCDALVGGRGTKVTSDHQDASYARPDAKGQPGYFTIKGAAVVSYSCDFTKQVNGHQAYNDTWTYDTDWTVVGGANNNGQWAYAKLGGNADVIKETNPSYIMNNKPFGRAITFIKVYYPDGSFQYDGMDIEGWGVSVFEDPQLTKRLYTVVGGVFDKKEKVITLAPQEDQEWKAGYTFVIFWEIKNPTENNGVVLLNKIEYYTDKDDDADLWADGGTGIEEIQGNSVQSAKILRDGQLYIVRDGKVFTATGIQVK